MLRIAIVEGDVKDAAVLCDSVKRAVSELGETSEIEIFDKPLVFLDNYSRMKPFMKALADHLGGVI